MKTFTKLLLSTTFVLCGASLGCREEVAHQETDRPNLTGGRTHSESTTYKNPDGSYTTEKDRVRTP